MFYLDRCCGINIEFVSCSCSCTPPSNKNKYKKKKKTTKQNKIIVAHNKQNINNTSNTSKLQITIHNTSYKLQHIINNRTVVIGKGGLGPDIRTRALVKNSLASVWTVLGFGDSLWSVLGFVVLGQVFVYRARS